MKYPEIFYFNIVEIWPKELQEAVDLYCKEALKMTFEEKRRQVLDTFRFKLFETAMQYKRTKEEMSNEQ